MAPTSSWMSLPSTWKLQDVQAALNVVITVLGALGTSAFAKILLQSGARKAVQGQNIPLSSLLSINTIGEAVGIMTILRLKMLRLRHWKIVAQFAVVYVSRLRRYFQALLYATPPTEPMRLSRKMSRILDHLLPRPYSQCSGGVE
jgi:hypothetical protein